jgi:PIN domain nuclease of toxin-antitoxin system
LSGSLLVDTHIVLWLESGDARLRGATVTLVDDHWRGGGVIYFSAISVWEIAMLVHRRRIELRESIGDWVARFLDRPGMEAIAVTHRIAARAYDFDPYDGGDPADHILIATAIELACPLVTYDRRILQFGKRYGRRHRFAAIAD